MFEYIVTLLVKKDGIVSERSMSGISDDQIEALDKDREACLEDGYYVIDLVRIEVFREVG